MVVKLNESDVTLIVECIDHRLYEMDQELNFYQEEPDSRYLALVELREFLMSSENIYGRRLTEWKNTV